MSDAATPKPDTSATPKGDADFEFKQQLLAAEDDIALRKFEALAKLAAASKPVRLRDRLWTPVGAAFLSGVFLIAVAIWTASQEIGVQRDAALAEGNAVDNARSYEQRQRQIQTVHGLIVDHSTTAAEQKPGVESKLCVYWRIEPLLPDAEARALLKTYVFAERLCGTDGARVAAFAQSADEPAEIAAQKAACTDRVVPVTHSCRAYDKAGFNGTPRAKCTITLTAPEGMVFAPPADAAALPFVVLSESYRKLAGAPVSEAVKVRDRLPQDPRFATRMSGEIGCDNDRGTGRTCETSATISAQAVPLSCLPLFADSPTNG